MKMDAVAQLLEATEAITGETKWKEGKELLKEDAEWGALDQLDQLEVYRHHVRNREREDDLKRREERSSQRRKERQARDGFKALLVQGEKEEWLHLRALWHEAYPEASPPCPPLPPLPLLSP